MLSESTAGYDCGPKFLTYQTIQSLQEYVLVHQDSALVEHYVRGPNETWIYRKVEGPGGVLEMPSVQCSLKLEDVYLSVFQA